MRVITELQKTIDYYKIKAKEAHRRAEKFKKLKNEPNQGYAKLLERERISNTEARNHEQLADWLTELQERREADRWISVMERLPEPLTSVIATDNNDVFVAWYNEGWNSSDSQFGKHTPVVAWRPISRYTESEGK